MERIRSIEEFQEGGMAGYLVTTSKQKIKLLIDDEQGCCESWGYFWCNDDPQEFVGANLRDVTLTDMALNTKMVEAEEAHERDDGDIMFVNLETSRGTLQFVAYNCHNGYYGHPASVECKQLKHEECL